MEREINHQNVTGNIETIRMFMKLYEKLLYMNENFSVIDLVQKIARV
ncbi:MAG: hypothetical protein IJU48_09105 [Synergistaceae bacterium]|nr:hypothetical protein [Synergistaceae bacterium]